MSPVAVKNFIYPGIYNERIVIRGTNIHVIGLGIVKIIGNRAVYNLDKTKKENNTFNTATVLCEGENISFKNIEFINQALFKKTNSTNSQAISFYGNGDNITFHNCSFKSCQDTLLLAPIPDMNRNGSYIQPPTIPHEWKRNRYIFEHCNIYGNIDYIFGGGSALFINCAIINLPNQMNTKNFITAPSTPYNRKYGFIFIKCQFIKKGKVVDQTVFLGRPWRPTGKVLLIDNTLDKHICDNGWSHWNCNNPEYDFAQFEEYNSFPFNSKRVEWAINKSILDNRKVKMIYRYFNKKSEENYYYGNKY